VNNAVNVPSTSKKQKTKKGNLWASGRSLTKRAGAGSGAGFESVRQSYGITDPLIRITVPKCPGSGTLPSCCCIRLSYLFSVMFDWVPCGVTDSAPSFTAGSNVDVGDPNKHTLV
jgi:hypothetical protein